MSKFYLYNVVKLPALPEWDKTVYPYAFIYAIGTNGDGVSSEVYTLIISASNQMVYDSIGIGFRYDAIGITKAVSTDGTEWVDRTYDSGGSEYFYVKREEPTDILYIRVAWANFDVLNANGSVYVAASEPVPVVEKFPIREWIGWLLAGLCSRPLPIGMQTNQDVLDNEWPIEWTSTVVANNATKGVSDGYTFVKVSHLTPTADTLSQSTLIVEALSDDAQDVVFSSQGQFGYGEDYLDVGTSLAIFFVTFNALVQAAFLLYICVVHIPNESFTETGIYYCLVKEKNAEMVGPSAAPFRFRLSKETEVS